MTPEVYDRRLLPVVYEHWLPVAGWEGWYEVSCRGRVRSLDRWVVHQNDSGRFRLPRRRFCRGRLLAPIPNSSGYLTVQLCRPGVKQLRIAIHILVLTAFAGPPKPGQESLHGRGGKHDNRWPENLRWGTRAENAADSLRDGTRALGSRNGHAKLTEDVIVAIRERCGAGEFQALVARDLGVSQSTISLVVNRRIWRHVA